MPSRQRKKTSSSVVTVSARAQRQLSSHIAFFPLLVLTFVLWLIYRSQLFFPVWFDETIGKGIFFGLPVWAYIALSGSRSIPDSFDVRKFQPGMMLGLAIGGLLGFVGAIAAAVIKGSAVQAMPLFAADAFWVELGLALLTSFWETLFFYTWVMTVIQEKFYRWGLLSQVMLTAGIFLAFHVPNMFLRFPNFVSAMVQLMVLAVFAVGQALIFARWRNFYTLMLSQAIWGMVVLIHFRTF